MGKKGHFKDPETLTIEQKWSFQQVEHDIIWEIPNVVHPAHPYPKFFVTGYFVQIL